MPSERTYLLLWENPCIMRADLHVIKGKSQPKLTEGNVLRAILLFLPFFLVLSLVTSFWVCFPLNNRP